MSVSRPAAVIVLAAGEGTRMKSDTPKVLHEICGDTLLGHVLATAREPDPVRLIVVVGHRRREVTEWLAEHAPDAQPVVQDRQGGTGHAVRIVIEETGLDHGTVVVTYADAPLLRGSTLTALVREHQAQQAAATVLTARVPDPDRVRPDHPRPVRRVHGDRGARRRQPGAARGGRDQLRGLRVRGPSAG